MKTEDRKRLDDAIATIAEVLDAKVFKTDGQAVVKVHRGSGRLAWLIEFTPRDEKGLTP